MQLKDGEQVGIMGNLPGKLFVISAPSGSGKTTLCELLMKKVRRLARSISVTTRPARRGEKNGKDYIFVTEKAFREKIKKGFFLEWTRNFGYYYGTPKDDVLKLLAGGRDVLLAIDVKGAMKVKKLFPGGVFVFILPPSMEELKNRLKHRASDSAGDIRRRMETAKKEMTYLPRYDYSVVNDTVNNAVKHLGAVVKSERLRKRAG